MSRCGQWPASGPVLDLASRVTAGHAELSAEGAVVMDRAGWNYPAGGLRVSDADRDRALCELSDAFQAGRITADEFDQRSEQAIGARTGNELTGLLADLPLDDAIARRATALEQAHRVRAIRIAIGAAAGAAFVFATSAAMAALAPGPSPQQRELVREMMARQGLRVPAGFPPSPGFDWPGTVAPAAIALLLILLIIYLRARLARGNRS
jgi:Domain of unknown function (DUF1707)